jgi:hypothetical protein
MLWQMSAPFQERKFVHRKLWKNSAKRLTHIGVQSQTSVPDPLLWNFDVHFAQKRTFPPDRGHHRAAVDLVAEVEAMTHLNRSNQGHSIIQEILPIFGPDTESQSRPKVDEQKRATFGAEERGISEDTGYLFRLAGHGVYGHARRVLSRHPYEGAAPHADMSETRKGNMRGANPVSRLRRIGKYAFAVHFGLILVAVVFDGHGGIRKLDSRDVNHISPDK